MNRKWLVIGLLLFASSASGSDVASRADLVFTARVTFVESDNKTVRPPLPVESFYLWFPFIGGDLYGAPTTDYYIRPKVNADYTFTIDLNKTQEQIRNALAVGGIGGGEIQPQPSTTALARVATFTVDPKTNQRAGFTGWMDAETSESLILAYFDRPCRVKGAITDKDHEYRYDIVVPEQGYIWLRTKEVSEGISELVASTKPRQLWLFVAPLNY